MTASVTYHLSLADKDESAIAIGLMISELREAADDTMGVALYSSAMPSIHRRRVNPKRRQHQVGKTSHGTGSSDQIAVVYPATEEDIARLAKAKHIQPIAHGKGRHLLLQPLEIRLADGFRYFSTIQYMDDVAGFLEG